MPDIIHEFFVKAPPERVFHSFATPPGLDTWWTKSSSGASQQGATLQLDFGPDYHWQARITRYVPSTSFELQITKAHPDWMGTLVGCELIPEKNNSTRVRFHHTGWPEANEHWRFSSFCWAMYLRLLRRNLEYAETVPYEKRLDA